MYYIQDEQGSIIAADEDLERLERTIPFLGIKSFDIKVSENIVHDFGKYYFNDNEEYLAKLKERRIEEIKTELDALDLKSIRAIRSNDTEYIAKYEAEAEELREELRRLL